MELQIDVTLNLTYLNHAKKFFRFTDEIFDMPKIRDKFPAQ